jgi:hypothetical protein
MKTDLGKPMRTISRVGVVGVKSGGNRIFR